MKYRAIFALCAFAITALTMGCNCTTDADKPTPDQWKEEIRQTEHDFMQMLKEKGPAEAFAHYADSNAAILRGKDSLIHGKEGIHHYYNSPQNSKATVTWAPDFVDVSADGTMGYTYGKYKWEIPDTAGAIKSFEGVFHTVWKRDGKGEWKYVWD